MTVIDQQLASSQAPQGLFGRLHRSWMRDRDLGLWGRLRKAIRVVIELANARLALRHCTSVGASPRVLGRMRVENRGTIVVGNALGVRSPFVPTELVTGPDGRIEIGDGVWINFGVVVAARHRISIGSRSQIGQHCIVSDVDIPELAIEAGHADSKPITIGERVWLAGRVTVRPGVTIGDGSIVVSGSIVETDIPANVIAGGIPARVLRNINEPTAGATLDTTAAKSGAGAGALRAVPAAPLPRFSGTLVSDFTIDDLAPELLRVDSLPSAASVVAPYGQVTQTLLAAVSSDHGEYRDFAVVWTRPESAISAFSRVVAFEEVSEGELLSEVDAYVELIGRAAPRFKAVFVPTWFSPPSRRGLGVVDTRQGGVSRALTVMNLRLMDATAKYGNVYVLNSDRWLRSVGAAAMSPKAWYLGKMAIARSVMAEAALDIRAALATLDGGPRKLLVLDLDDTLWGGIVGDAGMENLQLGTVDAVGEAFVDFQRGVKDLKRRGIVLAIVSKNEESVAMDAIRNHPEMVLREDDFVARRINWTDKARNIAEIATELNLGLQSVVFIDDNPNERARVREALPEVLVPEWPVDKFQYRNALDSLRCFDAVSRTQEDLGRTRMYVEEQQREQLKSQVGSIEDWLRGLEIKVGVELLGPNNIVRATQLLNKTNQLNLTTRRLTEAELLDWSRVDGNAFWTFSVSDRLGDAGLTGLVSVTREGDSARIVDYVLSCRVMGRKVEETLVHVAVAAAVSLQAKRVVADFIPTAKNKPCLTFWQASGFANDGDRQFVWDCSQPYALPDVIGLNWREPNFPW